MTIQQPGLTIWDFCPWNTWEVDPDENAINIKEHLGFDLKKKDEQGDYYLCKDVRRKIKKMNGRYPYLTDKTTGKRYLNLRPSSIRYGNVMSTSVTGASGMICYSLFKKSIANFSTPWGGLITLGCFSMPAVCETFCKIIKIVSLYHFRMEISPDQPYNFKGRVVEMGKDLLKVVASPLFAVGLLLAPIYGILRPMDGLKLQNSLEQAFYHPLMTECLQMMKADYNPLLLLTGLAADDEERRAILQRINGVFPLVKGPRSS